MTPQQFIRKWRPVALTERATAQEHFIDLCRMLSHPTPVEDDPVGDHFTFEKGVTKTGGGEGFADVWKKGFFAWEYKKKKRNLDDALAQLVRYAAAQGATADLLADEGAADNGLPDESESS